EVVQVVAEPIGPSKAPVQVVRRQVVHLCLGHAVLPVDNAARGGEGSGEDARVDRTHLVVGGEQALEPFPTLAQMSAPLPEAPYCGRETQADLPFVVLRGPAQRSAQVFVLTVKPLEPIEI